MNRISQCLQACKQEGRKALVTYIVHGDPGLEHTLPSMHRLVEEGADIIELGIPFSDPMAEGPVIQRGHERALANGASLTNAMELVSQFRQNNKHTPVVLMGYANPIERMGYSKLASSAAKAGVDGLLTVDLPPEEAEALNVELKQQGLENIFLIAPTTTEARMADITALAGGFVYYVSLKGVTGAGHLDVTSVQQKVEQIRKYTGLPVLVGFGIKDKDTAKAIGAVSDGVVVGSLLVKAMGEGESHDLKSICDHLASLIKPIRKGLDEL
ncbi:tryptophan synthase, alpha chain [Alteromonadaceae bacterium Bs31]|nr:tryptophan synthase, alpha chain [Alteromonadaceae bacterium Bs31]